ncbi:MbcA/ParS/Xre antitoxin family protein [Ectopseudomonas hydrolytica]|uniref:MbcA/ParS/Xre antitoxin family protein n=1 Tax=Ectopseudomonas hydrolytica TaxID=2493633 RepID=A0ABY5A1U1_9GAMM|nr:MbcA/ParS/Xre antitoxin family protein [Pseudomonas hydrolytica]USR37854.1 MbcA/ParS/Xre antitoxin family protein [Pseudomonas hydrolytica]
MVNDLEAVLAENFANILFDGRQAEVRFFGFECGGGWYGLVGGTLLFIQQYSRENKLDVVIRQVKEKFGELRIYLRGGDEIVDIATDIAGLVSRVICESCGCRGKLNEEEGWLRVRCEIQCDELQVKAENFETYKFSYAASVLALTSLFGLRSVEWLKTSQMAFNGRPPFELLATTEGCHEVVVHIGRLAYGVGV